MPSPFHLHERSTGASHRVAAAPPAAVDPTPLRKNWAALRAPRATIVEATPALTRSHAEWRAQLPADAYGVLFEENTEPSAHERAVCLRTDRQMLAQEMEIRIGVERELRDCYRRQSHRAGVTRCSMAPKIECPVASSISMRTPSP